MARYWRMTSILTWSGTLELSEAQLYEGGTPVAVTPTASVAPTSGSLGDLVDALATASVVWSGAMPTLVWDTAGLTAPFPRLGAGTSEDAYPVDLILQSSDDALYWTTYASIKSLAYPGDWTLPAVSAGAPVDPHAASVVLSLDGATDVSVNPKTITLLGNASESYLYSQFGGAALFFDGAGDSVTVPSSASLSGTGPFSCQMWLYPVNFGGGYQVFLANDAAGGFSSSINSSGTISFGRSLVATDGTTSNAVTFNAWNHVEICRDETTLRVFINGVAGYTAANSTNFSAGTVRLGSDGGGGALFYNGHIHELRLTQGVCRHTEGFTPESWLVSSPDPYFSNVSLLLLANGTHGSTAITDSSPAAHTVTPYGNTSISTSNSHSGGSSLYFDGSGDYLAAPTGTAFAFGTGEFTVEMWVRPSSVAGLTIIYDGRTGSIGSAAGMSLSISSGTLRCDTNVANVLSGGTLVADTWYHVALTRDSGTFRLWLDGVQVSSSAAGYILTDGNVTIGAYGGAQFFNGYIDDIRISKGVARYTAAFTPPAAYGGGGSSLTTGPRKYAASALASPVYTNPAPGFPTEITVTQHRPAFTFSDPIYGGQHQIVGTVKEKSTPTNKPLPRRVVLIDERAQLAVRETWSDAAGNYQFYGIRGDLRYTVISYDYSGTYRAVIADNVTPEPIV